MPLEGDDAEAEADVAATAADVAEGTLSRCASRGDGVGAGSMTASS